MWLHQARHRQQVGLRAHKGLRYEIWLVFQGELYVLPVLVREQREIQAGQGDVHAFALLQQPSRPHLAGERVAAGRFDFQRYVPVVDINEMAFLYHFQGAAVVEGDLARRAATGLMTVRRFEKSGKVSLENALRIAYALGAEDGFARLFELPKYTTLDEALAQPKKATRMRATRRRRV